MKGYKYLIEQNSLHHTKQMSLLSDKRHFLLNIYNNLSRITTQINEDNEKIARSLQKVHSDSAEAIQALMQQFKQYPQYSKAVPRQTSHEPQGLYSLNDFIPIGPKKFQIFDDAEQGKMVLTRFGSIFSIDQFRSLSEQYFAKFVQKSKQDLVKTKQKCRDIRKQTETGQIKTRVKQALPISHRSIPEELPIFAPSALQSHGIAPNEKAAQIFYCSTCNNNFLDYAKYSHHFTQHGFMIEPGSSHIIIKSRKGQASKPFPVVPQSRSEEVQRFTCTCKENKDFSRAQFVQHVFKWHKGITPKR